MDLEEYIKQAREQVEAAHVENSRTHDALSEAQEALLEQHKGVLAPFLEERHVARNALKEAESNLQHATMLRTLLNDSDYAPFARALTAPLDQLSAKAAMFLQSMDLIELLEHGKAIYLTELGEKLAALLRQID